MQDMKGGEKTEKAKSDLTMLATFISQGIDTLKESVTMVGSFLDDVDNGIESIDFWGWQMKILAACLFILPSFLIIGVGFVMLDLDVKSKGSHVRYHAAVYNNSDCHLCIL